MSMCVYECCVEAIHFFLGFSVSATGGRPATSLRAHLLLPMHYGKNDPICDCVAMVLYILLQERNLVDMCCTNSEVWAIWNESDGGECVKHLTYDGFVTSLFYSTFTNVMVLGFLCITFHFVFSH